MTTVPDRRTVLRAGGAIAATLLLSLLFIASYAGALHAPTPRDVPVAVSAQVPAEVAAGLERGGTLKVQRVADPAAAEHAIATRDAYGSITPTRGGRLRVTVAPAASPAISQLLSTQLVEQLRAAGVAPTLHTVHPLPDEDSRGTVAFYLGIGWVLAGYFGATLLGLALGTRLGAWHTAWRIVALGVLGLAGGLAGTAIAGAIGGYSEGFLAVSLLGLLTVLAVGTATVVFQSLFGLAGTGVAILLFVVVGNPAAGGAAPPELLPGLWSDVGQLLPNGAAVTGIRDAVYFPDASLGGTVLVLVAWFVASAVVALLVGARARGITDDEAGASISAAAA